MAKIRINGETFDYDASKMPMTDALALEQATGMSYIEWQQEMAKGSVKGFAGTVWLAWHRDGREVSFKDIMSGQVQVDLEELLTSIIEAVQEAQEPEPDPTSEGGVTVPPAAPGPDGTPTPATPTSASSRKSSASRPHK